MVTYNFERYIARSWCLHESCRKNFGDTHSLNIMSSLAPFQTVPTLYTYKESGNSYKVRLLAAFPEIELDHRELDFLNDQ